MLHQEQIGRDFAETMPNGYDVTRHDYRNECCSGRQPSVSDYGEIRCAQNALARPVLIIY